MASGKLGNAALTAATNATVYTVPDNTVASFGVYVVNRGGSPAEVILSVSETDTPTNAERIENVTIPAFGVLERTGIIAGAGERLVANDSTGNCSVRVHGYEEGAA
ncbi:MAG: hypothetical protein Q7W55_10485 [Pseudohongiella sp.]|nr:hypothetical protein [Pseudohongiella sp.]